MKKVLHSPRFLKALSVLIAAYGKLVFSTSRIRYVTPPPTHLAQSPVVFATWHQQIVMLPVIRKASPFPLLALMSGSRDGSFMRTVAKWYNIGSITGSSHRGAVSGARGLMRAAGKGNSLFVTPDGPRGPARIAKPGATEIARLTNLPVIPCAAWSSRGHNFNSWDKLRLPFPFSTITIAYGEALDTQNTQALTEALNQLTAQAQAASAGLASPTTTS